MPHNHRRPGSPNLCSVAVLLDDALGGRLTEWGTRQFALSRPWRLQSHRIRPVDGFAFDQDGRMLGTPGPRQADLQLKPAVRQHQMVLDLVTTPP